MKNNMLKIAKAAFENAYAPYSKFSVGCCVCTDDKQLFAGCNVENVVNGTSQCAEVTAISNMITQIGKAKIKEILVIGTSQIPCTPCGRCRQWIWEHGSPSTLVHSYSSTGEHFTKTISELLPDAFGPENLEET